MIITTNAVQMQGEQSLLWGAVTFQYSAGAKGSLPRTCYLNEKHAFSLKLRCVGIGLKKCQTSVGPGTHLTVREPSRESGASSQAECGSRSSYSPECIQMCSLISSFSVISTEARAKATDKYLFEMFVLGMRRYFLINRIFYRWNGSPSTAWRFLLERPFLDNIHSHSFKTVILNKYIYIYIHLIEI